MRLVKERIIGAITVMSEEEAEKIWSIIQEKFADKSQTWDEIEEAEPTPEELEIIEKYKNGDDNYQPYILHEDLKKKLSEE